MTVYNSTVLRTLISLLFVLIPATHASRSNSISMFRYHYLFGANDGRFFQISNVLCSCSISFLAVVRHHVNQQIMLAISKMIVPSQGNVQRL